MYMFLPKVIKLMKIRQSSDNFFTGLQEKVHRSTIANVNELDMHLMNERGRIVPLIVDAAIGQWRRRLSACVRGAGHTLSTKHKVSAILSCIYQKLLN